MAGRYLGKLLGGKGNVLLLRYQIHAANTEAREEGFCEAVLTEFPGLKIVASDFHAGPTAESAKRVSETLLRLHGANLNGVFTSSEPGAAGMLAALRGAGLAGGKVKLIGVDEGGGILRPAMSAGDVQGIVEQDSAELGNAGIMKLVAAAQGKTVASETKTRMVLRMAGGEALAIVEPERTAQPAAKPFSLATAKKKAATAPAPTANLTGGDFTIPDLDLTLISIPAGSMTMTASRESASVTTNASPITVPLPAFWIGQYELTQAQYTKLVGSNPSDFKSSDRPVENLSWEDAMEFCRKLTERERGAQRLPTGFVYTLPTGAQWEYACRAGTTGSYAGDPDGLGWFAHNSGAVQPETGVWRMSTHPVGQKQPNAWNLYDMHGNVSEWCLDPYGDLPGRPPTGPPSANRYRVLRGGCWWADVQNCRSDSRHKAPLTRRHSALGMRVALSPVTTPKP